MWIASSPHSSRALAVLPPKFPLKLVLSLLLSCVSGCSISERLLRHLPRASCLKINRRLRDDWGRVIKLKNIWLFLSTRSLGYSSIDHPQLKYPYEIDLGKATCIFHPFIPFFQKAYLTLSPVVERLDSAIHRINPYSANKYSLEAGDFYFWPESWAQLRYPVDKDLSSA